MKPHLMGTPHCASTLQAASNASPQKPSGATGLLKQLLLAGPSGNSLQEQQHHQHHQHQHASAPSSSQLSWHQRTSAQAPLGVGPAPPMTAFDAFAVPGAPRASPAAAPPAGNRSVPAPQYGNGGPSGGQAAYMGAPFLGRPATLQPAAGSSPAAAAPGPWSVGLSAGPHFGYLCQQALAQQLRQPQALREQGRGSAQSGGHQPASAAAVPARPPPPAYNAGTAQRPFGETHIPPRLFSFAVSPSGSPVSPAAGPSRAPAAQHPALAFAAPPQPSARPAAQLFAGPAAAGHPPISHSSLEGPRASQPLGLVPAPAGQPPAVGAFPRPAAGQAAQATAGLPAFQAGSSGFGRARSAITQQAAPQAAPAVSPATVAAASVASRSGGRGCGSAPQPTRSIPAGELERLQPPPGSATVQPG